MSRKRELRFDSQDFLGEQSHREFCFDFLLAIANLNSSLLSALYLKNQQSVPLNGKYLLGVCFQTASLPGRIDQIDHLLRPAESPNSRPVSPISVLRDSRPVSPLVFNLLNSNHTSPAPSPSPEHHWPSTPPIRYQQEFSPVKSEDDTEIHSGSSESDHEDDRMSTASCTSFTGRSTVSDMRDRELMATETILHWRNLPLSLTFRTWLKYTRQRKLQKELLNYLTNNKTTELMVKTLATWRRELYTKVTARQHWLDTSRLKCLRAWHAYTETKRIQEERKLLADEHRRLARLNGGFQKWKKRVRYLFSTCKLFCEMI